MDLKHVFLRPVALLLAAAMPFAQLPVNAMSASATSAITETETSESTISESESMSEYESIAESETEAALNSESVTEAALNSESATEPELAAALASESIPESEPAPISDSVSTPDAESAFVLNSESEPESASTDKIDESAIESHTITGFENASSCLSSLSFSSSQKPSLNSLLDRLPSTLNVYLDNSDSVTSIPITWFCVGEDYEQSEGYYFQFSPQWDEDTYALSDQLNLLIDAPYISIFLVYVNETNNSSDGSSLSGDGITTAAVTSSSYEEEIFNFLVNEIGFNSAGACGVMANLYYESSFNPNASGDGGSSYGICQWHNERYDTLKSWCKSNGYDYTTLNGQLNYLKFELSQNNSDYLWNGKTIYNNISAVDDKADGSYDSGYYWCVNYEIPANKETVGVTRGNLAKDTYWPEYNTSIASCTVTLGATVCAYTGKARNPSVTVKDGSTTLTKDTNYTVTYKNNVNVGTATVIVKGIGNYTGQLSLNYTIRLRCPALVSAANSGSSGKITWTAVTGATGYYVYHKHPGEKWVRIADVKSGDTVSYLDTEATAGQTWMYTVKAHDDDKNTSIYESGLTLYRLNRPSVNVSSSASDELTVSWVKDTKAKGYQIQYSLSSDFSDKTTKTITNNTAISYTFTGLAKNETYYVRIRRYQKIDGTAYFSSWSKVKDITLSK